MYSRIEEAATKSSILRQTKYKISTSHKLKSCYQIQFTSNYLSFLNGLLDGLLDGLADAVNNVSIISDRQHVTSQTDRPIHLLDGEEMRKIISNINN